MATAFMSQNIYWLPGGPPGVCYAQQGTTLGTGWPKYGGGDLSSSYLNVPDSFGQLVQTSVSTSGAPIQTNPALGANGLVFVGTGGSDNAFYAINSQTGAIKWRFPSPGNGPFYGGAAYAANGVVFVGCDDRRMYALAASTGKLLWQTATTNGVDAVPAIGADGTVYVVDESGVFYALDPLTGNAKWERNLGGGVDEPFPVLNNGVVFETGFAGRVLYGMSAATGSVLWSVNTGVTATCSALTMGPDATLYLGAGNQALALRSSDGSLKWSRTFDSGEKINPAAATPGGFVVFGSSAGNVYALRSSTGATLWTFTTDASVFGLSASHSQVYAVTEEGSIQALALSSGQPRWKYSGPGPLGTIEQAAIASDGTLYTCWGDGRVRAFAGGYYAYDGQVLAAKPAAYWKLNETTGTVAYDSSGNRWNGNYFGSVALDKGLSTGQRFASFSGGYVEASAADYSPLYATGSVTAEVWYRPEGSGFYKPQPYPWAAKILCKGTDANPHNDGAFYLAAIDGERPTPSSGLFLSSGTEEFSQSAATISPAIGEWHHLVGVWDPEHSVSSLWLDGREIAQTSGPFQIPRNGDPFTIGLQLLAGYNYAFSGEISDAAVYGHALTSDQIIAHYEVGLAAHF